MLSFWHKSIKVHMGGIIIWKSLHTVHTYALAALAPPCKTQKGSFCKSWCSNRTRDSGLVYSPACIDVKLGILPMDSFD